VGLRFRKKIPRGFTIVQVLVSLAVLGIALKGLSSFMSYMDRSTRRAQVISTMMALEGMILGALEDPGSYPATYPSGSDQNARDQYFYSNFQLVYHDAPQPVILGRADGQTQSAFSVKGDPCAISQWGRGSCLVRVSFSVTPNPATTPPPRVFAANYTIEVAPGFLRTGDAVAPIRVSEHPIDASLYRGALGNPTRCDPNTTLGVRGVDMATGEVLCWARPAATPACPANSFATGFHISGGTLTADCTPFRSVSCPSGYSLYTLSPVVLDSRQSPFAGDATCVYQGQGVVPKRGGGCSPPYQAAATNCILPPGFQTTLPAIIN
jgi:type II secretory pathway pseudopilin PulG